MFTCPLFAECIWQCIGYLQGNRFSKILIFEDSIRLPLKHIWDSCINETSFIWNMSQKVSVPSPIPIPSTPSSMLRAAFERLSFRSRRRKKEIKYDLVIEQRQKLDADKSDPDFDLVTEEETVQNNKFQDSKDLIT